MRKRPYLDTAWITKFTDGPYQQVKADEEGIWISFFPGHKKDGFGVFLTRAATRLLAKRMNQCLDATVKK